MPPLGPMLSMYQELKAMNWKFAIISDRVEQQRNITVRNLSNVGYEDYILILRSVFSGLKTMLNFQFGSDSYTKIVVFTLPPGRNQGQ